ncbi:MAG: hypothetical protein AAB864_02670 [Patescibacteria group bacterium]
MRTVFKKYFLWLPIPLLLVLVTSVGMHLLTSINQDIGRHLTLGKVIWETHRVPDRNLFSYTWPDFPFVDHHWLAEVLLYLGDKAVGLKGLIVVKAFLITIAFGLSFFAVKRRDMVVPACLVGLVSVGILMERTDVRPEVLSFLFWGWYLFVLFGRREKMFWTLPLIQVLWVNSHIYFFMGPLAFALFLVQESLDAKRLPNKRWLLTGAAIVLANLVNPSFIHGALYPLFVFRNYGYSIVENQSPFFLRSFQYPQFTTHAVWAGVVILAVSIAANFRNIRHRIATSTLGLLTAIFAFMMIRNFPLFGLALIPAVVQNLSDLGIRDRGRALPVLLSVILAALIYSTATNQISARLPTLGRFGLDVPVGSQAGVDFVRARDLKGPMFNNFDVGSFLIWKLPEERVFIDGRPEAYPTDFIQNTYIAMQEDPGVWDRERERYGIRLIFWDNNDITPWSQTFVARMKKDPAWPLVYDDGRTLIFVWRDAQ